MHMFTRLKSFSTSERLTSLCWGTIKDTVFCFSLILIFSTKRVPLSFIRTLNWTSPSCNYRTKCMNTFLYHKNKNNAVCPPFQLVTLSRIFSRSRLFGKLCRIFSGLAVIKVVMLIIKRNRCVIIDAIFFSIDVCRASPVPECGMLSKCSLFIPYEAKTGKRKS